MNHWKMPLLANIVILVAIFLISLLIQSRHIGVQERFIFLSLFMIVLAPLNLIAGMVRNRKKKPDGQIFIIIAGLLLLVGFSVCTGMFYGGH